MAQGRLDRARGAAVVFPRQPDYQDRLRDLRAEWAYRVIGFAGSIARAEMLVLDKPLLEGLQLSPPSVLLNTPLTKVPT